MDTCSTCHWWQPLESQQRQFGECHGGLPEIDRGPDDPLHGVWPITHHDDGCRYHNAPAKSQAADREPAG